MYTKTTFSHHWRCCQRFWSYWPTYISWSLWANFVLAVATPTAVMITIIFNLTSAPPSRYTLRSSPLFRQCLTNLASYLPCPQPGHPVWTDQVSGYLTKVFVVVALQFARSASSAYSCSHPHTAISLLLCWLDLFSCNACCGKGMSTNRQKIKSSTSRYLPRISRMSQLTVRGHILTFANIYLPNFI